MQEAEAPQPALHLGDDHRIGHRERRHQLFRRRLGVEDGNRLARLGWRGLFDLQRYADLRLVRQGCEFGPRRGGFGRLCNRLGHQRHGRSRLGRAQGARLRGKLLLRHRRLGQCLGRRGHGHRLHAVDDGADRVAGGFRRHLEGGLGRFRHRPAEQGIAGGALGRLDRAGLNVGDQRLGLLHCGKRLRFHPARRRRFGFDRRRLRLRQRHLGRRFLHLHRRGDRGRLRRRGRERRGEHHLDDFAGQLAGGLQPAQLLELFQRPCGLRPVIAIDGAGEELQALELALHLEHFLVADRPARGLDRGGSRHLALHLGGRAHHEALGACLGNHRLDVGQPRR